MSDQKCDKCDGVAVCEVKKTVAGEVLGRLCQTHHDELGPGLHAQGLRVLRRDRYSMT